MQESQEHARYLHRLCSLLPSLPPAAVSSVLPDRMCSSAFTTGNSGVPLLLGGQQDPSHTSACTAKTQHTRLSCSREPLPPQQFFSPLIGVPKLMEDFMAQMLVVQVKADETHQGLRASSALAEVYDFGPPPGAHCFRGKRLGATDVDEFAAISVSHPPFSDIGTYEIALVGADGDLVYIDALGMNDIYRFCSFEALVAGLLRLANNLPVIEKLATPPVCWKRLAGMILISDYRSCFHTPGRRHSKVYCP